MLCLELEGNKRKKWKNLKIYLPLFGLGKKMRENFKKNNQEVWIVSFPSIFLSLSFLTFLSFQFSRWIVWIKKCRRVNSVISLLNFQGLSTLWFSMERSQGESFLTCESARLEWEYEQVVPTPPPHTHTHFWSANTTK